MARRLPTGLYKPKGTTKYASRRVVNGERRFTSHGTDDLETAIELHNAWVNRLLLEAKGLHDPRSDKLTQNLEPFIQAWESFLRYERRNTDRYVRMTVQRVRRLITACRFKKPADIDPGRVRRELTAMGQLDGKREKYRGRTRAARYSIKTRNYYLQAMKSFTAWLRDETGVDPLADLSTGSLRTRAAQADKRHARREITELEQRLLIASLRQCQHDLDEWREQQKQPRPASRKQKAPDPHPESYIYQGVEPDDRRRLYVTALATGMRQKELRAITWANVDLKAQPATMRVRTAYAKNGWERTVPLAAHVADELRQWREARADEPLTANVFRMPSEYNVGRMMRADWGRARDLWLAEDGLTTTQVAERLDDDVCKYRDSEGRYADLHSLRHTFATTSLRRGVGLDALAKVGGWRTTETILRHYAHSNDEDAASVVMNVSNPETELKVIKMKADADAG